MPGQRQLLDERYGPVSDPKPLERKKLDRLRRRWKVTLTNEQMDQLEACLIEAFNKAEIARQMDGRWPSDPKDKEAAERANDLDRAHESDVRLMIEEVRNSAELLIRALTRDPKGTMSRSDLSVAVWYGLSAVDDWESGRSPEDLFDQDQHGFSLRRSEIASRALNSARELFVLAEKKLEGLPPSEFRRPKQEDHYLDELLRNFALIWEKFTGDLHQRRRGICSFA
jgi:hypothetical protein